MSDPLHLHLHDHYYYGTHAVIAFGYIEYKYFDVATPYYQRYLCIGDGWTHQADRFVWTNCKGDWDMTTVHPK